MPDLYHFAKRLLFALDPEKAHHVTLSGMNLCHLLGLIGPLTGGGDAVSDSGEFVEVMGLTFPNRVGLAAGLDKGGAAVDALGQLGFGHIEVGTVTPRPQPGNEKPRLFRLVEHEAIINRMGFNNPGTEGLLRNLKKSAATPQPFRGVLGINIGKNFDTPIEHANEDYLRAFRAVYHRADYVTVNLSSPNTVGLRDLQSGEHCFELIVALQGAREQLAEEQQGRRVPIVIKIAPDLSGSEIDSLAAVFNKTKVDGVIATNTTVGRPGVGSHRFAEETGGLSGAPLTESSTGVLARLCEKLDSSVAVIASGGVMSAEDALEKREAGADLVQIYTGLVYRGPHLVRELVGKLD